MESKNSFVLFYELEEQIADFTDAQVGALLRAIFAFEKRGEEPDFSDSAVRTAFRFISSQLERNRTKYENVRERRQEAGKKGGRPLKADAKKQKKQMLSDKNFAFKENQMLFSKADNVPAPVNDNAPVPVPERENDFKSTVAVAPAPTPAATTSPTSFDEFWSIYPRRVGKAAALKSWNRIHPDKNLRAKIFEAVGRAKDSDQWRREGGRYIPNPATWLNQGRWDDEVPAKGIPPDYYVVGEGESL